MTARPVILWAFDIPLRRHLAYCRSCDWHVSDSSLAVVFQAGQAHRATHEGTP